MGISVGIVGLGAFGSTFVKHFKNHPQVSRVALCDMKEERLNALAREYEITETYRTLDEICRSDIEAIALFTQPWLHAEQAIKVMEAGKHVYCAVPPAFSHDDNETLDYCDKLVETVKRTGLNYMLGETTFFRAETIYCRQRAAKGDFGRFVYCEGEYLHDMSLGLYEVMKRRWGEQWGRDKSGSVPMHYPTHSTSGIISITGARMRHVSAMGYILPDDDWFRADTIYKNPFSNEVAIFRMSNGAIARISEFRRVGHKYSEQFRIFGTEGSFLHDVSGAKWCTKDKWEPVDLSDAKEPLPQELTGDLGGHGGSHAYLVHEFVDSILKERLPRINVWEAVRYLVPGIIAHRSALKDGELMEIPDWGDPPSE